MLRNFLPFRSSLKKTFSIFALLVSSKIFKFAFAAFGNVRRSRFSRSFRNAAEPSLFFAERRMF